MVEIDETVDLTEEEKSRVFTQLKAYCFEPLELLQNPKKHSSALSCLLHFLRQSPCHALQPFFDYTLFSLLLLLDATVDCRTSKSLVPKKKVVSSNVPKMPRKVSDSVADGVLQCLEELLKKCLLGSVYQECLCALVIDDSEEVSAGAQESLRNLFTLIGEDQLGHDVAQIFTRLIDKLPKVVLGSEESLALSHAQQLLVIMYYSGPQFVVDHILQSPVTATRFLDIFSVCMSQNSVFAGCLDKLLKSRSSSVAYLASVSELKAGNNITSDCLTIMAAVPQNSKIKGIQEKDSYRTTSTRVEEKYCLKDTANLQDSIYDSSLGLSLMTDIRNGQHLSLITEIPLGCLRKSVSEICMKDYNKASWHSWYNRTGSGQLLRQASTAVCILNEMIFGISDQATDFFTRIFPNSRKRRKEVRESGAGFADGQPFEIESSMFCEFSWKVLQDEGLRSHLIDCIGRILHEFLSHEVWELPTEHKSLGIHYILTMKLKILV